MPTWDLPGHDAVHRRLHGRLLSWPQGVRLARRLVPIVQNWHQEVPHHVQGAFVPGHLRGTALMM